LPTLVEILFLTLAKKPFARQPTLECVSFSVFVWLHYDVDYADYYYQEGKGRA